MRAARRSKGVLTPITLRDVYAQLGDYSVKMMIDKSTSAGLETVDVSVRNSDGSSLLKDFRRWGTKLTLSFRIDEAVPDGLGIIDVRMVCRGREIKERFDFWIVK